MMGESPAWPRFFSFGLWGGIDGDDKPSVVTHRTFEISANFWFGPHLPGVLCPLKHLNAMEVGRGGMNGGREREKQGFEGG